MLTTQIEHELPTFPFAAGPGVQTWRTVTLHIGVTYVFVSYGIKHGKVWLPQTTVFWRHEDVLTFCKDVNKDKNRRLVEVFLLSPGQQEVAYGWSFLSIKEVLGAREGRHDAQLPVYVTADGAVLSEVGFGDAFDADEDNNYEKFEKIFSRERF